MADKTLSQYFLEAKEGHWAVPHFNFSSLSQLNGIIDVVRELKIPALLGTSEGERTFIGLQQALYLVRSFREEEGLPVFLNADHCHSVESAKEAFEAGYESVHLDLSKEPYEDNRQKVKEFVEYAKSKRPETQVEGELGYLATDSSHIYKEDVVIPEDSYTKPEQAIEYVKETGIDRLAPAVGTIHGIAKNTPQLKFELIQQLDDALPKDITLVLHGGSGVTDEEMKKAVQLGFNNIHVSTELRVAFTGGLREKLQEDTDDVTPYHYLAAAREATAQKVREKIAIFGTKSQS